MTRLRLTKFVYCPLETNNMVTWGNNSFWKLSWLKGVSSISLVTADWKFASMMMDKFTIPKQTSLRRPFWTKQYCTHNKDGSVSHANLFELSISPCANPRTAYTSSTLGNTFHSSLSTVFYVILTEVRPCGDISTLNQFFRDS